MIAVGADRDEELAAVLTSDEPLGPVMVELAGWQGR
jgi:hypothetical protein